MSRYATFQYDTSVYGSTRGLSRSSIFAQVLDYTTVYLEVSTPTQVGKNYVLVRTRNGAAEDPSAGLTVSAGVLASPFLTVTDGSPISLDTAVTSNLSIPPGLVYYTLFSIDSQGSWTKEAATSVLIPVDKGTMDFFINALPGFYTSAEHNPADPATTDSDLYRFLYGFALTYDELSNSIDMILPENRTKSSIRRLHDSYAKGVGMPTEYTIGVSANARLYRAAGSIYRSKGTLNTVSNYAEALTGWQTKVIETHNKFLSLDDASFESTAGNWGVSGGTLTREAITGSVSAPTWANETSSTSFARQYVGKFALTSTSGALTLPSDKSRLKSIPVTPGTTYYFKSPVRAVSGTPTVKPQIEWLDQYGTSLSTTDLTSAATTTSWVVRSGSAVAPTNAAFAVLKFAVTGSSGDAFHFDMLSFSSEDRLYRDPRSVDVICQPDRVNLVYDSSFENSTNVWTTVSGTLASSTEQKMFTGKSGKLTGSTWEIRSNQIPVVGYYGYSLSAYAYSPSGTATASIKWYSAANTLIRTDTASWPSLGASWKRLDFSTTSPSDAAYAYVHFDGGGTVYLDLVMFERTDRPQVFFSGLFSDVTGIDGMWAGTANQSYSLLYANRAVKVTRLKQTLPYYLPVGVTARVLLWDSPDPAVTALLPNG